jgi:formylglycine-generating enzyme required for sulfatase activity
MGSTEAAAELGPARGVRLGKTIVMTEASASEKLKVFISYSRRDSSEFAEELVAGLELAGFAPFLDRHDIAAGEEWEARLGGLIRQADTVVYVVSPEAVKSPRCEWEVERALAQSKRLLPVIFKAVAEADIPEQLRRRQFIRFDSGPGITRPLTQLAEALRQDIEWIREHTRLEELAERWVARARPESLLLRGEELASAQSWADKWKPGEPAVTDSMRAFFASSKEAEVANFTKTQTARRRARWAQALAALCAFALIAVTIGWWKRVWLSERTYALANVHTLTKTEESALKPQDVFKECTDCPEMMVIPAGSFVMGSPPGEAGRKPSEGPQHNVTIAAAFAVSKFELTFASWDSCVAHGDCDPRISDGGFGRGAQPVINVTWGDAQNFVRWLAAVTGKPYRLLSEAEYEYAAHAGTTTAYPWGTDIGTGNANCIGCGGRWNGSQPAPAGSFAPNQFGLYDMIGNVWEWVEDCAHNNYDGAPQNGSAWGGGDNCDRRVARGGTWNVIPASVRSGSRLLITSGSLYFNLGFRVGRSLTP